MRSSSRTFTLIALVASGLFLLTQESAQAQYRRPVVRPVVPILPPPPRALVVTPTPVVPYPYTNPYALQQSIAATQLANYNAALYTNRALMMQYQLYNPLYNPYRTGYVTPGYPAYPYMTPNLLYTAGVINPGLPYNPANAYNPYFAAFGFRP